MTGWVSGASASQLAPERLQGIEGHVCFMFQMKFDPDSESP